MRRLAHPLSAAEPVPVEESVDSCYLAGACGRAFLQLGRPALLHARSHLVDCGKTALRVSLYTLRACLREFSESLELMDSPEEVRPPFGGDLSMYSFRIVASMASEGPLLRTVERGIQSRSLRASL